MGWQNSHLHMFRIADREYGPAYLDDELETLNEKQFRVGDLVKTGDLASYEYDFGDGWEHEIVFEGRLKAERNGGRSKPEPDRWGEAEKRTRRPVRERHGAVAKQKKDRQGSLPVLL